MPMSLTYNDKVVRQFTVAMILWGIVGMTVGAVIAPGSQPTAWR